MSIYYSLFYSFPDTILFFFYKYSIFFSEKVSRHLHYHRFKDKDDEKWRKESLKYTTMLHEN